MEPVRLTIGEILGEARALLIGHLRLCAGAAAAIMLGYTLLDQTSAAAAGTVGSVAVSVFGQYHFIEAVLGIGPPATGDRRRYLSLFGSGLLSGLGIVAGLVFLLVPGLYLLARWSIASPMVVAAGANATGSLGQSWEATRGSTLPIAVIVLLLGLAMLVLGGAIALMTSANGSDTIALAPSLVINAITASFTIGEWLIALAIYRLLGPDRHDVRDVFA